MAQCCRLKCCEHLPGTHVIWFKYRSIIATSISNALVRSKTLVSSRGSLSWGVFDQLRLLSLHAMRLR